MKYKLVLQNVFIEICILMADLLSSFSILLYSS